MTAKKGTIRLRITPELKRKLEALDAIEAKAERRDPNLSHFLRKQAKLIVEEYQAKHGPIPIIDPVSEAVGPEQPQNPAAESGSHTSDRTSPKTPPAAPG